MSKTVTIDGVVLTEEQIREAVAKLDAPEPKRNRWEFNDGDAYFFINSLGVVNRVRWRGCVDSLARLEMGNVFHTRKEAEQAVERQKALVRMLRWADENAPFTPDKKNGNQKRWYVYYNLGSDSFSTTFFSPILGISGSTLPTFATKDDAERFMKECEADLRIFLTV